MDEYTAKAFLVAMIVLGLAAGLVGAYGRERHEGRSPDGNWWLIRLLIMPFLALASTAATDFFALSPSRAAFVAAFLALLGYDAIRLLTVRVFGRQALNIAHLEDNSHGKAILEVRSSNGGNTLKVEVPDSAVSPGDSPLRGGPHIVPDPQGAFVVPNPAAAGVGMVLRETYAPPSDHEEMSRLLQILDDPSIEH